MPEMREWEANAAIVGLLSAGQWQQVLGRPKLQRRRLLRRRLRLQLNPRNPPDAPVLARQAAAHISESAAANAGLACFYRITALDLATHPPRLFLRMMAFKVWGRGLTRQANSLRRRGTSGVDRAAGEPARRKVPLERA